jgi:RND family efflux transporter MFP subunit
VGVTVQVARQDTIRDVAAASGVVVPSPAGDWTIYAPEVAQITSLPKKQDDEVAIGDVLVRFEIASLAEELAARQLAVTEARARAERAKTEFARLSALFERGIAPRNTYEAARAEQTTADSILGQAQVQLESAKVDEARATARARFPGKVVKLWHAEGDVVSGAATDPVLRVIDPSHLQVAVQIPVAQLARIVPGQTATVRAIAGDASLPATVAFKPATTDPNAPTGEVRLAFTDPSTLALDTPVSVEILLDQRTSAVVVPADAVQRDDISPFVVIAGDDGRAHRRDVRIGLVTRALAEIVAGLSAGERVIVGGVKDVEEGTAVAFVQ